MLFHKNLQVAGSLDRKMLVDVCYEENQIHKPVIIYVHGFNGFKDWGNFDLIASEFVKAGFVFVKFNLSHNGTSIDAPEDFTDLDAYKQNTYSKELFDTNQIIQWLYNPTNSFSAELDLQKIVLLGHSRGGGIVLVQTAEDPRIKACITWASVANYNAPWKNFSLEKLQTWKVQGYFNYENKRTNQLMPIGYELYTDYLENQERFNLKKAVQKIHVPLLICHGTQDPAVSHTQAVQLHQWQPNSTLFLLESDHVFGRKHPWNENYLPQATQSIIQESIRFLNNHLKAE